MKDLIKKHIYKILIISLIINLTGFLYVAGKLYHNRLDSLNTLSSKSYASILNYDSLPPDFELNKTLILNALAGKFNYNSYLEIGQGKAENNFNRINCKIRIGVDPNPDLKASYCLTSDEFFELNKSTFDLIFIDGLHHNDQVYRDIINSLNCLNEHGTIIVHDCNPENEATQIVPQQEEIWTGDVWRAWVKLRSERDDLEMFVVTINGCGIIRAGEQETINIPDSLTYQYLSENRDYLLNLKSDNDFLVWLKKN